MSGTKKEYVVDVWSGNHPFYLVRQRHARVIPCLLGLRFQLRHFGFGWKLVLPAKPQAPAAEGAGQWRALSGFRPTAWVTVVLQHSLHLCVHAQGFSTRSTLWCKAAVQEVIFLVPADRVSAGIT